MTLKTFLIGMFVTFAVAWMGIIALPTAKMGTRPAVKLSTDDDAAYYQHSVSGRILNGAEIYQNNGCYTCHTRLVRPTYAGNEMWRKQSIAGQYHANQGKADTIDDIDTRRETSVDDYTGERFANIGLMRIGPDLSNVGYRIERYAAQVNLTPEQWAIEHLYNPRSEKIRVSADGSPMDLSWSNCPAQLQMFSEVPPTGQVGVFAVQAKSKDGSVIEPQEPAHVLASYLLSLKRDDELPASMSNAPQEEE